MFNTLNLPFDPTVLLQLDLLASLLLLVVLWIARKIVVGTIRARTELPPHDQRRLIATSRNVFLFLLLVGLVLIWAPQLRTFALSLTAVAVAIVVATKELILCLSGAVLRATTRAFGIGDWIEVGDNRGEVTDHTLLATTLEEFGTGPHIYTPTGRMIVLPNSMLLTTPVRNQTALREDTYHRFAVTLDPVPALGGKREVVTRIVHRHYEPFRERAARASDLIERRTRSDLPDPTPAIRLRTSDLGKLRVEITLFCPSREAERLESDITWDLLATLRSADPKDADEQAEDKAT
ncbi:Small-conductance mechanosensitive channel [Palleronia marisminoris]|uniref:Mechanosensitive ion channel n=1 Tax=Palleronia marisminoris TaxID=315423 RepID=A0A1Y5THD1_9RHOB|nr:mechanosensitive ion channel domain-containing protein [Palleronia marisminoris]SFH39325.1 Small-conductance mechanosensitive channel [Palleronia marisminoris]SLN64099.1 Mechanosensitive ion channel [Palleronia marisminoris]